MNKGIFANYHSQPQRSYSIIGLPQCFSGATIWVKMLILLTRIEGSEVTRERNILGVVYW